MSKSRIFFILSLSFIGGVGMASFFYPKILSSSFIYFFFVLAIVLVAIFWKNKRIFLVSFSIIFFAIGFWLVSRKLEMIQKISDN